MAGTNLVTDLTIDEQWALIDAARDGDHTAFTTLYRIYLPVVRTNVAWVFPSTTRRAEITEEVTAEAFLVAWRHLHALHRQPVSPVAWFVTIARNKARDHIKSPRHWAEIPTERCNPDGDTFGWTVPETRPYMTTDRVAATLSIRLTLSQALATLPERQREAVVRKYLQGETHAQIQAGMGLPTTPAAKELARRGVAQLRKVLDGHRDLLHTI